MMKFKFFLISTLFLFSYSGNAQDQVQQKIDYYLSQAKLDSAKLFIYDQLDTDLEISERNGLNYQMVKVLFIRSEYNEALELAFSALETIGSEEQKVKFNFMIACIYSAISDFHTSIDYFDLVIENNRDSSLSVQTYLLLSELHLELSDSLNAKISINKAHDITTQSTLDDKLKNHVAMQYNFFNGNYELCKQQNFSIIKDSTSFLNTKSYAYSMIGSCLLKQDSLEEASKYFDQFLTLTIETNDPEQIKVAAKNLILVYEKIGNQEKANSYHKIYNEALNNPSGFSIEKYRELYDIEKNRELEFIKARTTKQYLLIGFILFSILGMGIYFLFKKKQKQNPIEGETKKSAAKKIVVNSIELEKISVAIDQFIADQKYLTPNITRKSFCTKNDIKSERYLSHYINDKYKKSFSSFVNDLRIEYAYNQIHSDSNLRNYKIEEIAKECGFGSKKSFERVFLAKYNVTPYKLISNLSS